MGGIGKYNKAPLVSMHSTSCSATGPRNLVREYCIPSGQTDFRNMACTISTIQTISFAEGLSNGELAKVDSKGNSRLSEPFRLTEYSPIKECKCGAIVIPGK
jgi:hypothetical protein